ncbi:MAG: DivIVA domain-containing protein [Balneolaceae bacterium]
MKLTALEIKQQTFDKAIRGYDSAEVQAFLTLVSNEWEHMVTLQSELEKQLDALKDKLKHYERVESALHETLQTAKDSADQKLSGARQESRNILQKAELEAEEIIREAYDQRREVRQDMIRLLDRRKELIASFRSYLQNAQETLNQFSDETEAVIPPVANEQRVRTSNAPKEEAPDDPEKQASGGDPSPTPDDRQVSESNSTPEETLDASSESSPKKPKKSGQDDPLDNILDQID